MTIEFDGQNNKLGTSTANSVTIKTNDTDAVTIDSSQNVGVGTNTPSAPLDVNGQIITTIDGTAANVSIALNDGNTGFFRPANNAIGFAAGATEIARFTTAGLAIGGTGSANTLDDYEEGTWTPSFGFGVSQPTAGNTTGIGLYTKVGNMVTVWGTVRNVNVTGASGDVKIRDLPFTSKAEQILVGYMGTFSVGSVTHSGYLNCDVEDNTSTIRPLENISGAGGRDILNVANCSDGATDAYFCVSYQVN